MAASFVLLLPSTVGAQEKASSALVAVRITLEEAQARAVAGKAAELAWLNVDAARYHRQAAQADYFPKINSTFINLHFNKFMGQRIQVLNRPVGLPVLNKDETLVAVTLTQPVTPLFKVHQGVRIARADERIAKAKAAAATAQVVMNVEKGYFELLIAQRRQTEAEAKVEITERQAQIASAGSAPLEGMAERQTALLEAQKELLTANNRVTELTNSLTALIGLSPDTRLELAAPPLPPPPPLVVETVSAAQAARQAIASNPEIVEAEQTIVKARAAHRLSKLEYVPDVAILGGYAYQTASPLLPNDFSFIGVVATFNLFDFGKRERTIKERRTQVEMAEANLELVRAKVAAGAQKTITDVDRTRRILELTRQVAALSRAAMPRDQAPGPEARAALAKAEAEMFQADLDYRAAYAQFKRVAGEQ
ncbi:MAG: TolC family protein [Blastocatellales bacterium]